MKKISIIGIALVAISLILSVGCTTTTNSTAGNSKQLESYANKKGTQLSKAMDVMMVSAPQTVWELPAAHTAEDKFLAEIHSSLEHSLEKYKSIPEVSILKERYGGSISVASAAMDPKQSRYLNNDFSGKVAAFVYPLELRQRKQIPTLIGYFNIPDYRGIIALPGIKTSDQVWFDARFIHELYHQYQYDIGAPGATAPSEADIWVEEEIHAHNLAAQVLDAGTSGKYLQKIRSVNASAAAPTATYLQNVWTAKDLAELDGLFGPATKYEITNRLAQYYLDIIFEWLKTKYKGDELHKNLIHAYRNLHS